MKFWQNDSDHLETQYTLIFAFTLASSSPGPHTIGCYAQEVELLWLFTPQAFLCLCPSGLVSDARVRIPTTRDQQNGFAAVWKYGCY